MTLWYFNPLYHLTRTPNIHPPPPPEPGIKQYFLVSYLCRSKTGLVHDNCNKRKKKSALDDCNHCSKWKLFISTWSGKSPCDTQYFNYHPKLYVVLWKLDLRIWFWVTSYVRTHPQLGEVKLLLPSILSCTPGDMDLNLLENIFFLSQNGCNLSMDQPWKVPKIPEKSYCNPALQIF